MKLIKLPILLSFLLTLLLAGNAQAQCPAITASPTSTTVCAGVTVKFGVVTTAVSGRTYRWQVFDGVSWTNITGAPYTGFLTDTLTIVGSPASIGGYQYRCVVSKIGCSDVTSNAATLNLNSEPIIVTHPKDSITCLGSNTTFEVDAIGANLTYQWEQKVGSAWNAISNLPPFSGATTRKLLISNPPVSMDGTFFRVSVGGSCPPSPTVSDSGKLIMLNLPIITAEPSDAAGCLASSVTFATAATGTNVAFQWQYDDGSGFADLPGGLPYIGVYTNKLDITGVNGVTADKNGWKFRCVVSGACSPADTTKVVTLIVQAAPSISSVTTLDTLCAGENAEIEVIATGSGLKYRWSVDTGTGFFQLVDGGVYNGVETPKLKLTNIPNYFNGYTYRAFIEGTCPISKYSDGIEMVVLEDKSIGDHPRDTTVNAGVDAKFNVTVLGTGLQLQWQVNDGGGFQSISLGSPYYSGVTTNMLTVKNPTRDMQGYQYRCLVYGGCDEIPVASNGGLLNVWWPASVNDLSGNNDISVYPNPATGSKLTLKVNNNVSDISNIKIIDHFGRTLLSQDITLNNIKVADLDISSLPTGVYSILVTDRQFNMIKSLKFTKL
jgi:hypothetical protein